MSYSSFSSDCRNLLIKAESTGRQKTDVCYRIETRSVENGTSSMTSSDTASFACIMKKETSIETPSSSEENSGERTLKNTANDLGTNCREFVDEENSKGRIKLEITNHVEAIRQEASSQGANSVEASLTVTKTEEGTEREGTVSGHVPVEPGEVLLFVEKSEELSEDHETATG